MGVSSRHETVRQCTERGASLRIITEKQISWTKTNGELCIRGFVGVTMSSLVQMIVSEFMA